MTNVHPFPNEPHIEVSFASVPLRAFVKVRGKDAYVANPKLVNPENHVRLVLKFHPEGVRITLPLTKWSQQLETAMRKAFGHKPAMGVRTAELTAVIAPLVASYRARRS